MIVSPGLLATAAEAAGIEVPPSVEGWDEERYARFTLFVNAQVGRRLPSPSSHWRNAKIVASLPEDRLKTVSLHDLEEMGLE